MPVTQTRILYTIAELKASFPAVYKKICQEYRYSVLESVDIPWVDEVYDSLKAVITACGGTIRNYSLSTDRSWVKVSADNMTHTDFIANVLTPNGYTDAAGNPVFPGICAFTGYCADDDFLESVNRSLSNGDTLTEALNSLSCVANRLLSDDLEQACNEESCEANSDGMLFTEDGKPA